MVIMKLESCKKPEDRYAPPDAANTLPNEYDRDTTRSSNPSSTSIMRPPGLYKPVVCALHTTRCRLPVRREDLVHGIKHDAKQKDSFIHATYALDSDEHHSCPPSVPESPERSMQRTHFIVREGIAQGRCDAGDMRNVVQRNLDGLVVEQGTIRFRHAREEVSVGVEAGV